MFDAHNVQIVDLCRRSLTIDEDALSNLRRSSNELGRSIASLLIDHGHVGRDDLLNQIARYLELPRCVFPPVDLPRTIIDVLDVSLARMYGVVPVSADEQKIDLLAVDPFNSQIVDDLSFALGRAVHLQVADPDKVEELIEVYYKNRNGQYADVLEELDLTADEFDESLTADDLLMMAGETPIIRFVNLVLAQAIKDKASDVHFEPFESEFKIRYRIDGALYDMSPPPRQLALPIVSRIKVIGDLNIAERRIPQDGKVRLTVSGRPVDLRISTLPTQFGESVVLRVLDQSTTALELDNLGMPDDVVEVVERAISRPNGIFIVTGPTGSGKTTTLYSCLKKLNIVGRKLMTVEDPIEYEIDGIMQVSVNTAIDLGFATALKAFLRQDPDTIMVGEIRDLETAQIAVQSSLTGHLVLSTLHTNDAPGAVTRLEDMGVEPFLIASSLEAVLAQRLLRRVCRSCKTSYIPTTGLLNQLDLEPSLASEKEFYKGGGCAECANTGSRGRLGIYEMLEVNEPIRELITGGLPAMAIREQALQQGMRTLRDDGLRNLFMGTTSIEEVIRYT